MDVVGRRIIKYWAPQRGLHPDSFTRRPFLLDRTFLGCDDIRHGPEDVIPLTPHDLGLTLRHTR
jgi:hypothetical protein